MSMVGRCLLFGAEAVFRHERIRLIWTNTELGHYLKSILGKTDVDIVIDGIAYQVKATTEAFGTSKQGDIYFAKLAASGYGLIKYVTPPGVAIPLPIREFCGIQGIPVEEVNLICNKTP